MAHLLDDIFHPRSIAIIGASTNQTGAQGWLKHLLDFGYPGQLYPVNPNAGEILGLKAYPTVKDIPGPVDHVIFNVPARLVPRIMQDCAAKGVRSAHVYAAGFSETGKGEGRRLEAELSHIARQGGIRVIGPNCMGLYCPASGVTFDARFSRQAGTVAFFSQSGASAHRLILVANSRGIRFSKVISYGNAADLDGPELLEYLAEDPETKIIIGYIEGMREGHRFRRAVEACIRTKPVILLKAGLTQGGAGAAASHTAALAGSEAVWRAFFKQTGAIPVESLEEAIDLTQAFLHLPPSRSRRTALVGRGGGFGVMAADACERAGLPVPQLGAGTREQLEALLPNALTSVRNPVEGDQRVSDWPRFYREGLKVIASDPQVDLILVQQAVDVYGWDDLHQVLGEATEALIETAQGLSKPLVVVTYAGVGPESISAVLDAQQRCLEAGLPAYATIEAAAKALSRFIGYYEFLGETA